MISHYLEFFMKNHFSFILGDPIKAGNHHLDINYNQSTKVR